MANKTLIMKGAELNAAIAEVIKNYREVNKNLQIVLVSAITMAAETGQVNPLNRLFKALTKNDQRAVRLYIARYHTWIGYGKNAAKMMANTQDTDIINAAADRGKFLNFEGGHFSVIKDKDFDNAKANKAAWCELAPKLLLPKTPHKRFNERDNVDERKTFGDEQVVAAANKLYKMASGDGVDKNKVNVDIHPKVAKLVADFHGKLESLMENGINDLPDESILDTKGSSPQPAVN